MTSRQHPWPTDGVTKKQLDRLSDRTTRRIDHWADKVRQMELQISKMEQQMILLLATNQRLAEYLAKTE